MHTPPPIGAERSSSAHANAAVNPCSWSAVSATTTPVVSDHSPKGRSRSHCTRNRETMTARPRYGESRAVRSGSEERRWASRNRGRSSSMKRSRASWRSARSVAARSSSTSGISPRSSSVMTELVRATSRSTVGGRRYPNPASLAKDVSRSRERPGGSVVRVRPPPAGADSLTRLSGLRRATLRTSRVRLARSARPWGARLRGAGRPRPGSWRDPNLLVLCTRLY